MYLIAKGPTIINRQVLFCAPGFSKENETASLKYDPLAPVEHGARHAANTIGDAANVIGYAPVQFVPLFGNVPGEPT